MSEHDPRRDADENDLTTSLAEDSDVPGEGDDAPGRAGVADDADQEASPTGTIGLSDHPVE